MFIPLHDANSLKHIKLQYVTLSLITANLLVWLLVGVFASIEAGNAAVLGLGFIPSVVFDAAQLDPALQIIPDQMTVVTYAFMHLGFWHLTSNMLFLWVFGDNVEDALGHLRFVVFYLACAAAGALFHGFISPSSQAPLIGASGAVSGVVAAYLLLHPKVRVWVWCLCAFLFLCPPMCRLSCGSGSNSSCWHTDRRNRYPGARMWAASSRASFSSFFSADPKFRCWTGKLSRRERLSV